MLTLTRLVGERILIGDDIVIEVRSILDGKQVRISIDAPRQVPIRRAEIVDAVLRANLDAARNRTDPKVLERSIDALGRSAATRASTSTSVAKSSIGEPGSTEPGSTEPGSTEPGST